MSEQAKTQAHLTITDLTDITDVYLQYSLALANATVTNSYTFSSSGEIGWSTTYPTWVSGYQIWIRQVRIKEGMTNPEYGTPYLDTAVNQINVTINAAEANITALQSRLKKIWTNLTNSVSYPAGTYAASGIGNAEVIENDSSTYGYNTFLNQAKLALRYNAIDMITLTTNALTFYIPTKDSNENWIQGQAGLVIDADALTFYNPSTHSASATLSATGLNINDGSIHLGSSTTDRVHFSTRDLTDAVSINSESRIDWRLYLGDKFGVTKSGYMSASRGKIGGTTIDTNRFYSLVDGTGYSFSNGGEFSITGTDDSYIKMEQTDNNGEIENTLSVQLSKLYMTLGEVYGQDEIINVIEVINDQITFSQLWEGSSVWLYEKDGKIFDVYEYVNSNNQSEYYYNNNQFANGTYILTSDTVIDAGKDYYIKNNDNEYIEVEEPTGNPHNKGYYELVLPDEDWQKYTGDVSNLTEKLKDGLQSALSFTTDSLQNEQKLLISSGHEKDESETVSIEVDPSFISLIANSEDLTMQFRMSHDTLTNTANIQIIDKEEEIFSIEDKNGYVLSTTTGFKAGPLGIFHYKKGLAIGMI